MSSSKLSSVDDGEYLVFAVGGQKTSLTKEQQNALGFEDAHIQHIQELRSLLLEKFNIESSSYDVKFKPDTFRYLRKQRTSYRRLRFGLLDDEERQHSFKTIERALEKKLSKIWAEKSTRPEAQVAKFVEGKEQQGTAVNGSNGADRDSQNIINEMCDALPAIINKGDRLAVLSWIIDYAKAAQGIAAHAQRAGNTGQIVEAVNLQTEEVLNMLLEAGYDADFKRTADNQSDNVLDLIAGAMQNMKNGRVPPHTMSMIADKFGVFDDVRPG